MNHFFTSEKTRVRYIFADVSNCGPLSYYKQHSHDDNAMEAVKRWENGVMDENSKKAFKDELLMEVGLLFIVELKEK